MGTYLIPRDLKGEGRILTIFSYKALVYTVIGIIIGYGFYFFIEKIGFKTVGIIIILIFALTGFCIGTLKMPSTKNFQITQKTGGEKVDEILLRLVKFKMKKNRIYIYTKEEKKGE